MSAPGRSQARSAEGRPVNPAAPLPILRVGDHSLRRAGVRSLLERDVAGMVRYAIRHELVRIDG